MRVDQQACTTCLLVWPASMFSPSRTLSSGLSRQCKDCTCVRGNLWLQYGISPCPNEIVRLIVQAFHGRGSEIYIGQVAVNPQPVVKTLIIA
jgi:hypothetical protein